jgi:hypothetical protein
LQLDLLGVGEGWIQIRRSAEIEWAFKNIQALYAIDYASYIKIPNQTTYLRLHWPEMPQPLLKILSSQKRGGSSGVSIDSSRLRTQSPMLFRYT